MALEWTERQIAMLAEMSVRVWSSPMNPGQDAGTQISDAAEPEVEAIEATELSTWQAMEAAVRSCRACGLCGRENTTCGPQQARTATWLVVRDMPADLTAAHGDEELLLDRMLRAVGRSRTGAGEQSAYLTTVMKCRQTAGKCPGEAEVEACCEHLRHEVRLLRPRVILAMGRFASRALVGSQHPLGALRGQTHAFEGVPVVVTYPVAYLLRHPLEIARAWADLCLAADVG
ncbi:MAG: uracil-DNA glycosylase [Hydrogenophaga sp.]|uniref:uracil-DNA glycosylase n=1 Tax=Hydrogenophaga sp. TaxID=1904254 RepID=UPI001E09C649|nr:uracil-DNA glycosylase [Hydrogenophaga sp.]MBX3609201.1 uracil-DNA glycosylase [Hydrogenophaga sp.]